MNEKGGISVQTEHIFPIIKRWLYSDKEIFLRELVSNASDAVTKLRHLIAVGTAEHQDENFRIDVVLDPEAKTISVTDNGIGMTEDEIRQYINQIALSGALDFIQKYENASTDGIIGHFGLGFYSAFMVADKVEIQTKSYQNNSAPVHWQCTEEGEFEISDGCRTEKGTQVILHVNEDEAEFLKPDKLSAILEKYCSFLAVPVFFSVREEVKEGEEPKQPRQINENAPLWMKAPSECTEEEYKEFYKKVFHDYKEPLFYIHLNADYPLNFKGILYFPKLGNEYENLEGEVKLYYNRVFVADNIKEVIPEYLLMLKGVLDCPELPLNVSRSYLQNSGYVSKISTHIVKKVCDKLTGLYRTEPETYKGFWEDIKIFVEYGCMKDEKFFDRMKEAILFKTVNDEYLTLEQYKQTAKGDKVFYTSNPTQQAIYVEMFRKQQIPVIVLDKMIDSQFISVLEMHEKDLHFLRVDAPTEEINNGEGTENEELQALFVQASGKDSLKVRLAQMKDDSVPAILNITEQSRRMAEMMELYGMRGQTAPLEEVLVLNAAHPLIDKLQNPETTSDTKIAVAGQIYMLALLSQRQLNGEELKQFLNSTCRLMEQL